jgi:HAD superfamily phosphatase (TIGR01668 family)
MLRLLTPNLRIESVLELTSDRLRRMGLAALLLDVDGTLKNYRAQTLRPEVMEWLRELDAARIGVCLLSNGRSRRIGRLAERLALPFVSQACKPLPFGCRRAMRMLDFRSGHTAVVGDQLFADVMAARLAGLMSILVRPIHPEEEPWFTRMKRPLERVLLRHMRPPIEDFGRVCSNRCLSRKP